MAIYSHMKDRDLRAEGLFIAEGRFLVERALASNMPLDSVLCLPSLHGEFLELTGQRPRENRPPVVAADRPEMELLCGFPFHRGVLAAGPRPAEVSSERLFSSTKKLLVCSDVRDPFNLGGLFRSAAALGWDGVVLVDNCADPYSRAALRASMGAVFSLPWIEDNGASEKRFSLAKVMKREDFFLCGAVLSHPKSVPLDISSEKIALMVGNEGAGLSEERRRDCDHFVSIPMTERVDSLNVGVAAGILMYLMNQRPLFAKSFLAPE